MYISDVTLCCIDNQFTELGFDALSKCTKFLKFEKVIYFTSSEFIEKNNDLCNLVLIPVDHIKNLEDYSNFMIKELHRYIKTNHCIIVQWDGFIVHPELWNPDLLNYDYVGAPWPTKQGLVVGNGGFSLRSKKLLDALQDDAIVSKHPEDQCICLENRAYLEATHGIIFAPSNLAQQFAFELHKPDFECFGFHAVCNLPLVLSKKDLINLIRKLPPKLIFTVQFSLFIETCQSLNSDEVMTALKKQILMLTRSMNDELISSRLYRHIIKTCIRRKLHRLAFDALFNRIRITGWNADTILLLTRIYTHKLLHRF